MIDAPSPDYRRSRAVLMGAWEYTTLPAVPAAENSFQRMTRLLTSDLCGWPDTQITCLENVKRPANLAHQLIELFDDADDVALFYYVGHGQSDDRGRLCLGLTETRTEAKFRASTSLKFEDVRDALHHSNARTKIVLLDCCFAGLATSPEAALGAIDVADRASCEGAYTIAASAEYDVARYEQHNDPLDLPQTYFTKHFCDVVQTGVPGQSRILTLESIFRQVSIDMQSKQLPQPTQTNRGVAANFPFANNSAAPQWKVDAAQAIQSEDLNSIFGNLSRRSQAIVERQLSLIDRLEQDERDPDQLALLFELDHLITRMRRNSESLLVLSGASASHQLNRPIPAAEVIGAAVSEIEHYARVEVTPVPDVAIHGRVVSDLVHVIAELLDNATSFSEPEEMVVLRTTITRARSLAIEIADHGIGMPLEQIESANARLAGPPDIDAAVTRRMGLYVVARLAKRHKVVVQLRNNEDCGGGLIAMIDVPAELVGEIEDDARHQPPDVVNLSGTYTNTAPPALDLEDPPTARLPIYEEAVLSRWFLDTYTYEVQQPENDQNAETPSTDASGFTSASKPGGLVGEPQQVSDHEAKAAVPPSVQRSAESTRDRMSSWQQNALRAQQRILEAKNEQAPENNMGSTK